MMSIGLTEELSQNTEGKGAVIYFFCQNTDYELNTVHAVIKGLILRLIEHRPILVKVLRKSWSIQKNDFVTNIDKWQTLWDIFLEMLDKCRPLDNVIFIVIDALDGCQTECFPDFLRTIIRTGLD